MQRTHVGVDIRRTR